MIKPPDNLPEALLIIHAQEGELRIYRALLGAVYTLEQAREAVDEAGDDDQAWDTFDRALDTVCGFVLEDETRLAMSA